MLKAVGIPLQVLEEGVTVKDAMMGMLLVLFEVKMRLLADPVAPIPIPLVVEVAKPAPVVEAKAEVVTEAVKPAKKAPAKKAAPAKKPAAKKAVPAKKTTVKKKVV